MSDPEERIMALLSADNPRSRQHREDYANGYSTWRCIPIKDVVESGARDALLAAPSLEAGLARALHATGLNTIGRKAGSHGAFTPECICNADAAEIARAMEGKR